MKDSKLSDIQSEANLLIHQTSSIIKSFNTEDNDSQIAHLSMMIPKLDEAISSYKPFFPESIQICGDEQFMNIANKSIKTFLRNRRETILTMYQKTFEHYHRALDELTSEIVKTSVSINTLKENSSTGIENQLSELKQKYEAEYERIKENNSKTLESLDQKINQKIGGMDSKVGDEDQRLKQHYEKIIKSKEESLKMTELAYEKAKNEVDATTIQAKAEIESIVTKNNEILNEHNKSVMSSLDDEEKKVNELQEKVQTVTAEFNKIAPEFDKKWQEKEKVLLEKFKEEDDQFSQKKSENDKLLESTEKQINEYNATMTNIQNEGEETLEKSKKELEEKLQNMIKNRQSQIDQEVKSRKEKYEAKIVQLNESLKKVKNQLKNDEDSMKGRMQDKAESHQDRLKKIKDDQIAFISNIQKEIQETKEAAEKVRIEWDEERAKIESDFDSNLNEVEIKRKSSRKYFEMKFEALRKELHHVLQENAKIFNRLAQDNDDLLSLKLKHKEEEAEFSARMIEKMKNESDQKIKEKMDELRAKHSAERDRLLSEINSARETETGLQSMYNDALNQSKKEENNLFTSLAQKEKIEEINENESMRWRREIFDQIKSLKGEEAQVLEELCQTKDEFKEAVDKALVLREKLTSTTKFYIEEVEKAKGKNEEQLNELKQMVVEKQKELNDLEFQYDENEKELNRKARLVEKAEDKLNELRNRLSKEKELIRQKIVGDYQPLISQEMEKSQLMVREITELTESLQNSIEFKKNELELIDASNLAMIEGIRKETSEKVKVLEEKLDDDLKESEAVYIDQLIKNEEELLKSINEKVALLQLEESRINQELQDKLVEQLDAHKIQIAQLNDECMKIMTKNCEKKAKINQISNAECSNCFIFQKNIKKVEKQLIAMQEEERDLTLADKNHNETYKTFHNSLRKTLPPLRKY